ncbi:MAG: hypothetical protein IT435_16285 [Phycisphaerales bacterium]|nr:hypothetical protein [Phycisphaerales bacterium]
MAAPDVPIELHTGPIEVEKQSQFVTRPCRIQLVWVPRPQVVIHIDGFEPDESLAFNKFKVRLPGQSEMLTVVPTNWSIASGVGAEKPVVHGLIEPVELEQCARCATVTFHLVNFLDFIGSSIRDEAATCTAAGRAMVEVDGWRITLDRVVPEGHGQRRKHPEGTYLITHVGQIGRVDGADFCGEQLKQVHAALWRSLSFCRGAWTTPMLLIGHDARQQPLWYSWSTGRIDARDGAGSWFNRFSTKGFEAFAGFFKLYTAELWSEPIGLAIHWYVECNTNRDNVEGAIILQQAAFELLAWTLLVEERGVLSKDGIQKLPAADQLRLLLSTCCIPLAVPPGFDDLQSLTKEYQWPDGPAAVTEIRNALVHANPSKRRRILDRGFGVRCDAWQLGQWYLELVLLRIFDYRGHYSNRLRRNAWRGEEVEQVPWAS